MNLNMIRLKTETEDILLSMTKNCEMLIEQTHRKTEETLEFKMIKPHLRNISFSTTYSDRWIMDVRMNDSRKLER